MARIPTRLRRRSLPPLVVLDPEHRAQDHLERDRLHARWSGNRSPERPGGDLALGRLGHHRLVGAHPLAVERRQHQLAPAQVLLALEQEQRALPEERRQDDVATRGDRVLAIGAEQALQRRRVGDEDHRADPEHPGREGLAVAAPAVLEERDRPGNEARVCSAGRARLGPGRNGLIGSRREPLDGGQQLVDLLVALVATAGDGIAHAVVGVVGEELAGRRRPAPCRRRRSGSARRRSRPRPRPSAAPRGPVPRSAPDGAAPPPCRRRSRARASARSWPRSIYGEGVSIRDRLGRPPAHPRVAVTLAISRAGGVVSIGQVPCRAALAELRLHSSGKVREMYELDGDLLMVASDRISAYDVIMPNPIPDKGRVLTQMSLFWFESTGGICPNHFLSEEVPEEVAGRAIRVQRLDMYPVECVVRGYLSGSGWREYRESGAVCGIELPAGLRESDRLAGADLHARDQGRGRRPRREHRLRPRRRDHRRPAADGGAAAGLDRALRARRCACRGARHHPRRHEVRVRRLARGRGGAGRRGLHPRLLALLAGRRVRARPVAALLRQAVPARLARPDRLGPHPPAPELPEEVVANTRAEVPRGLRADHRQPLD